MESHRLLLAVIVFGTIVAVLFGTNATITGFVPTETHMQRLDIDVSESQRFVLSQNDGDIMSISSFAVSGVITGPGLVNVYLSDGDTKWLVFTNKKRRGSSMAQITGLTINDLNIRPEQKLGMIETLPEGYDTRQGVFANECFETCVLDEDLFSMRELYLDVSIEPGTSLHISEIIFSQ